METKTKQQLIAQYAQCENVTPSSYDANVFDTECGKYMVLTDDEANAYCRDAILESAWAFNKSFLDSHSEIIASLDDETWAAITKQCESSNKAVLAMIVNHDAFVEDAIDCDGRGHFLSYYDGNEIELADNHFAYRMN